MRIALRTFPTAIERANVFRPLVGEMLVPNEALATVPISEFVYFPMLPTFVIAAITLLAAGSLGRAASPS